VLDVRRRVLGQDHLDTWRSVNTLASLYGQAGRQAEAEALFTSVLDARRRLVGAEHPDTLTTMSGLGRVLVQQKKYAEATPVLSDALRVYERALPTSVERFSCQALLGASLAGQEKYQPAEAALVAGYDGLSERRTTLPPDGRSDLEFAAAQLVQLYRVWNKPDKAAEWMARTQQSPPSSRPR
jgi:hypothetical protein